MQKLPELPKDYTWTIDLVGNSSVQLKIIYTNYYTVDSLSFNLTDTAYKSSIQEQVKTYAKEMVENLHERVYIQEALRELKDG